MSSEVPKIDTLVIRSPESTDPNVLLALGALARENGCDITFMSDGATLLEIPPSSPPERVPEPVYATIADFRRVARAVGRTSRFSAQAWNVLRDDFIRSHDQGQESVSLVTFAAHPPVDQTWGRSAEVTDLNVRTLATYVVWLRQQVKDRRGKGVIDHLREYTPDNTGKGTVDFWGDVVEQLLPPQEAAAWVLSQRLEKLADAIQ